MNGKDKISVIIPCYNVQKYIMRCFDSIYSQTYDFENLEVILIDDLSTDNTWSILESLQRQYPENVISLKIQKKENVAVHVIWEWISAPANISHLWMRTIMCIRICSGCCMIE